MSDKQLREALRATYIALVGCEDLLDIIGDKCDVKAKADGDEFSVLGSIHGTAVSVSFAKEEAEAVMPELAETGQADAEI